MQIHTPEMTDKIYEGMNVFNYNGQNLFTKEMKTELLDIDILTHATSGGHVATEMAINLRDDLKQYISYGYVKLGLSYANKGPFEFHLGRGKNQKVYKVPQGWYISLSVKSLSRGIDSFNSKKNPNINAVHLVLPPHTVQKFAEYDCEISNICYQQLHEGSEEMIVAYGPADAYVKQKIDAILCSREMGKTGELIAEGEMELLFLYILMESVKKKRDSFDKIKDIIRHNVKNAPSVDEIAKLAGVSQRTLHNMFKKRMGLSPKTFIQMERMQEAESMLSRGEGSVNEVARALGFTNAHHFSVQFKKRFGVTPFQILEKNR